MSESYQYVKDITGAEHAIQRQSDKAVIPYDPTNKDYAAYLSWVSAGNTPLPAS